MTFGRFGLARLALQWLWGRFTGAPIPSRPVGRTGAARSPGSRSSRSESASFSASLRSAAVPSESYAPSPSPDTGKRGKGGGRVKTQSHGLLMYVFFRLLNTSTACRARALLIKKNRRGRAKNIHIMDKLPRSKSSSAMFLDIPAAREAGNHGLASLVSQQRCCKGRPPGRDVTPPPTPHSRDLFRAPCPNCPLWRLDVQNTCPPLGTLPWLKGRERTLFVSWAICIWMPQASTCLHVGWSLKAQVITAITARGKVSLKPFVTKCSCVGIGTLPGTSSPNPRTRASFRTRSSNKAARRLSCGCPRVLVSGGLQVEQSTGKGGAFKGTEGAHQNGR